jgi:hypothetical protein
LSLTSETMAGAELLGTRAELKLDFVAQVPRAAPLRSCAGRDGGERW